MFLHIFTNDKVRPHQDRGCWILPSAVLSMACTSCRPCYTLLCHPWTPCRCCTFPRDPCPFVRRRRHRMEEWWPRRWSRRRESWGPSGSWSRRDPSGRKQWSRGHGCDTQPLKKQSYTGTTGTENWFLMELASYPGQFHTTQFPIASMFFAFLKKR